MKKELDFLKNQIKKAPKEKQRKLFIDHCLKLIQLKEENKLTEEEVGYEIIEVIKTSNLVDFSDYDDIFEVAGRVEIPRISSFVQSIGKWNKGVADEIKQSEWKELIEAVEKSKRCS